MSTVIKMRFNDRQGALIADESAWHLSFKYGYRRCNYADQIIPLFESCQNGKSALVYAGVGFPSFHREIATAVQKMDFSQHNTQDLLHLVALVFQKYQQTHSRMVDDALRFYFSFGRDELNALSFKRGDKTYQIRQQAVIEEAKKILKYQSKTDQTVRIFENPAALIGYSEKNGLEGYYLGSQQRGIDFATGMSVIGEGAQVASHIFGKVTKDMELPDRRQGFDFLTGLVTLLEVAVQTRYFQGKMGGYFHLAWIDGDQPEKLIHEQADHRLHLAAEIAQARCFGFLDRKVEYDLIADLLLHDGNFDEIENRLFESATDTDALQKCLMGYKLKGTGEIKRHRRKQ